MRRLSLMIVRRGRTMTRRSMMGLVREGKARLRGPAFIVTWDIDSRDKGATSRTQYFLFGRSYRRNGRDYAYPGFVWKDGVRYVAQSAVFVAPHRLAELVRFLARNGIDHDAERITIG